MVTEKSEFEIVIPSWGVGTLTKSRPGACTIKLFMAVIVAVS
jgi:hypothetical protein